MELKFLIVSDTHEAYEILEEIVSKESENIDFIIHSGDYANIKYEEKHLPEVQDQGLEIYKTTIEILKKAQKPIFTVPGNVNVT